MPTFPETAMILTTINIGDVLFFVFSSAVEVALLSEELSLEVTVGTLFVFPVTLAPPCVALSPAPFCAV